MCVHLGAGRDADGRVWMEDSGQTWISCYSSPGLDGPRRITRDEGGLAKGRDNVQTKTFTVYLNLLYLSTFKSFRTLGEGGRPNFICCLNSTILSI